MTVRRDGLRVRRAGENQEQQQLEPSSINLNESDRQEESPITATIIRCISGRSERKLMSRLFCENP